MQKSFDTKTYAAFLGAVLIGGSNFVAVSFSNAEIPPLFGAALRFGIAALLFFIIGRVSRVPLPRGREAVGAMVYGLLGFGVSYAFLYYALIGLTAGTAAVILATVPLFTLIIVVLLGQERLSLRGVLGGVLAIVGIGILSLNTLGGNVGLVYLIAVVLGAIATSVSSVVAKAFPQVHPVNMNTLGMAAGAVLLVVGSLALGEPWVLPRETQTLLAIAWLILFGSLGLFQLFLYVIRRWSASATVYAITGMPLVAVVLGALLLNQPITPQVVVAGAFIIVAVYVGAISRVKNAAPETAPSGQNPGSSRASDKT